MTAGIVAAGLGGLPATGNVAGTIVGSTAVSSAGRLSNAQKANGWLRMRLMVFMPQLSV